MAHVMTRYAHTVGNTSQDFWAGNQPSMTTWLFQPRNHLCYLARGYKVIRLSKWVLTGLISVSSHRKELHKYQSYNLTSSYFLPILVRY